ncbi:MAG TPA: DUF1015 domain-containing protein [Clostridiaceae bacterium]|jgi:uncharacterized protein (DUF1015 family)|nr:DUF1015 domain-containing protein [Clostridiaceae bacterium]
MAKIRAFKAIRPVTKYASEVAALPYDVMNSEEARLEIQGKPNSFMRIDRPETTLDKSIDIYDERVYQQAVINMNSLLERGIMQQDSTANLYLYELTMDGRSQTGVVCCASVDEYLNETIKKHEKTRADKLADRIKHVDVLDANTGPIFLAYKKQEEINTIVNQYKQNKPESDFTSPDGVTHRIWVIDNQEIIQQLVNEFAKLDALYIADGHHRCASGVEVAKKRRAENPGYSGDEEFNYFLAVVFSDHELKILDYNRVVKDLNGLSEEKFFAKVEEKFTVESVGDQIYHPQAKAEFGMYYQNEWYKLTARPGTFDPDDPVNSLDVAIMQNNLLQPILGIKDPRTDQRIDFVGGIRGLTELERRVDCGEMKVAFSMYPTSISELFAVADANELMPPKSTWFEPKLRSGLFIHKLS